MFAMEKLVCSRPKISVDYYSYFCTKTEKIINEIFLFFFQTLMVFRLEYVIFKISIKACKIFRYYYYYKTILSIILFKVVF